MLHSSIFRSYFDSLFSAASLATHRSKRTCSTVSTTVTAVLPPRNVGLRDPEHVDGRLVQLHEHPVEDLTETEKLQDLADLGADAVDTVKQKGSGKHTKYDSYTRSMHLNLTSGFRHIWLIKQTLFHHSRSAGERTIIINHHVCNSCIIE